MSIAARYPYKPYRHHRVWSRARQLAIQQADVERTLAGDGGFAVVTASDEAEAVVTGRPLTWDSEFFGVPMGRLDGVFSDEALPNATLADAIRVALAHLQGRASAM